MRHWATKTLFGSLLLVVTTMATHASTLQVSWTFVNTEVVPRQATYRSPATTFFVIDADAITDSNNVTAGLNQTRSGQSGFNVGYKVRYSLGRGALTKVIHTAGTNLSVTIVPHGEGCSATVRYFKSPGKRYFETLRVSNHEKMLEADQHAEDVVCQVKSAN